MFKTHLRTLSVRSTLVVLLASCSMVHADGGGIKGCRQLVDEARRLACYDALPLPAPDAAPISQPVAKFGLEDRSRLEQVAAIESHIVGRFEGWEPRGRIKLANGQVWQIVDDSRGVLYRNDPKVRVRRGALGAFYLELEGARNSPRVVRID